MAATVPTFAELAGDTEPRLIEASRLFRATAAWNAQGAEGAKAALIGATDAAAREASLRWLENVIANTLASAEMIEGARADASDTSEWDMEVGMMLAAELAGVAQAVADSAMARDPDWPTVGKVAMDLCDPTIRGEATRTLRDMWWRAMMTEQIEARKKPGAFLASVGIVAADIEAIVGEAPPAAAEDDTGDPPAPEQPAQPPREHPPMPRRGEAAPRLPGARRDTQPAPGELRDAFSLMVAAQISENTDLLAALGVSKSTWNNWLSGRTQPRINVHQARLLSAECARIIADVTKAEALFREVTK